MNKKNILRVTSFIPRVTSLLILSTVLVPSLSFAQEVTAPTGSSSSAILISTSTTTEVKRDNTQTITSTSNEDTTLEEIISEEDNANENVLTLNGINDLDTLKNFEGIVRQSADFNCGPAALATLLTQSGYPTSESRVTDLYKALYKSNSEKGIDLFSLKKASMEIGTDFEFKTYIKKWTLDDIQEYMTRTGNPVLVHNIKKGVAGHYSVIREIKNDIAYISDTEAGNIEFLVADYSNMFDDYVLIVIENVNDVATDNDTKNDVSDGDDISDEGASII